MKAFLVSLLFSISVLFSWSQQSDSSVIIHTDSSYTYSTSKSDSESIANMGRNLSSFVRMQKESERKQMKQAYIRIAVGVLFLVVLIVGLLRKRKK